MQAAAGQTEALDSTDTDPMIATEELCEDVVKLLISFPIPQEKEFDDTVEILLARLEDYCALIDLIRSESAHCLGTLLPQVLASTRQLEPLLLQVDRLDQLVQTVKHNVDTLDAKVSLAETEIGQFTSLKKSIKYRLTPRSSLKRPESEPPAAFQPPEVFSCNDYFNRGEENVAAVPSESQAASEVTSASETAKE